MERKTFKALIIEDNIFKAVDIKRALEYCGIQDTIMVSNQEAGFSEIYKARQKKDSIDLIITDMQYPLRVGTDSDKEAGFKLIRRMKEESLEIPIIICSSRNYLEPGILGTVWYNELRDINRDFKAIIEKLDPHI